MAEYEISRQDLTDAENFLVQFMTEMVPEANLEEGGAVRDLLIKGFASVYAFLRGEISRVEARQSLLRIQDGLTEDDDIAQAVDEILSNWFISRKSGDYSQMTGRFHFTEQRAQSIPAASQFWRTNTAVFVVDTEADPYIISENQLFPVFGTDGILIDYVVDVPLRALRTGEVYDIDPGRFVRIQVPGGLPYLSYVENTEKSDGGVDIESSEEMIERSDTAIAVRNLVNNRSCDATLQELFPAITETLTIGMAEPEQVRDRRAEIGRHILLHIGGHYDTYVTLPLVTVEENLTVGGYFTRPDGVVAVFRDPELTYDLGRTFETVLGVQPGFVLHLRDGVTGAPQGFTIIRVSDHELEVSLHTPFPEASDEADTNAVQYSIGWLGPGFEEIELTTGVYIRTAAASTTPAYEAVPYGTSRRVQDTGTVVLSGKPIQDVTWVEITDPPASLSSLIDPSTGTLIFHSRVNVTPIVPLEPAYTQYQVTVSNWEESQSMNAVNRIVLGGDSGSGSVFDGYNLRVVYKSLANFSDIHTYAVNRTNRVAAANHLIRARHPIWIEVNIPYRLKTTTTETLDEDEAAQNLASHINAFDPNDDMDASDLSSFVRANYGMVGAVYPLEIYYHIDTPDGQQVFFSTSDIISIAITNTNGVVLENSEDLTPPQDLMNRGITQIATAAQLADWFAYVGVSDRTVHYRTTEDMISFVLRS